MKNWYGIDDIEYIPGGNTWSDSHIAYRGYVFNIHDIEDAMWEEFCEDYPDKDIQNSDTAFAVYMKENEDEVFYYLNNLIEMREENEKQEVEKNLKEVENKIYGHHFFIDSFTGELFATYEDMLRDGKANYDLGDPTNAFTWKDYYEEVIL